MIAELTGRYAARYQDHVVLDVAGVGYRVFVSLTTLSTIGKVGSTISLKIHTIVREDALLLYGFAAEDERAAFRALIQVKGVGPKVARSILGVPADELARAVAEQDVAYLGRLPGVGKRIAERLAVELKNRLGAAQGPMSTLDAIPASVGGPAKQSLQDLSDALAALGYRPGPIGRVIKKLRPLAEQGTSSEELVKEALRVIR